jgi:predicted NAD/FAD-binding protein
MLRIAVIGSGIAGMSAAYFLSRRHEVHLFERADRLGGHTHTHLIDTSAGRQPIDTGFIVHNDRTYPNFIRLMRELGVARRESDMSFGVSCRSTGLEYSSRGFGGFFAKKRNIFRPRHWALFAEIVRFNRQAKELLSDPRALEWTIGDYLAHGRYTPDFARYYLYPMAAAVWSTSLDEIELFPAVTLVRFFDNHGLLGIDTHPQWYVLQGGSSAYIPHLTAPFRERIHLSSNIAAVERPADGPTLRFADGRRERFDEVVFACHAPQALALLAEPTAAERAVLGALKTTANRTVLHTDETILPVRRRAWASWNYHLSDSIRATTLTYHMNRLQSLRTREEYCVTLNDLDRIRRERVIAELEYWHPLFTLEAIRAQGRWGEISGHGHTHFCGAYWFYGFHEDGLRSGLRVARALGAEWAREAVA